MPWTLAGVTIHPDNEQFTQVVEANYAVHDVLDAVENYKAYFGAKSDRIQLSFTLDEDVNSNTGRTTLRTACRNGSTAALVGDAGSWGNYRILSISFSQRQALNHTNRVWNCTAELIEQ